ncbi:hypothetical protein ACM39_03105 [Chryseobacterium sp. FH2]|uniref:hypothetical protein n=1 Tax=Chryseobacterium sp. FH2 TaxID=1674291 RepID=UPI00065D187F|nr:hypothetical protein [Chryseobacterium sp. FH2]KMQ69114.1 hypothetical protein ACM39_03105 [Chryseobacterium sp. FH2]
MKFKSLSIFLLIVVFLVKAQENDVKEDQGSPVIFEVLSGDKGAALQLNINKTFKDIPKLSFFSVSNISSKWNEKNAKDAMSQFNLAYEFTTGFRILGGVHYTPSTGLRPSVSILYSYIAENITVIVAPRIDLSDNSNLEGFGMIEYRPKLNEKWKVYSRLQGLYAQSVRDGAHARSYVMIRMGLNYSDYSFGFGANFDKYGQDKITKNNFGIFAAVRLFK